MSDKEGTVSVNPQGVSIRPINDQHLDAREEAAPSAVNKVDKVDKLDEVDTDVGIRAEIVLSLSTFAMAQGIPRERILQVTGLSFEDLLVPDGRVPELALHVLWKLLADHCPGRAIALELAKVAPIIDFGVLVHAAQYADTVRSALKLLTRYSSIVAGSLNVTLTEGIEEATLRIYHPLDEIDGGHAAEMSIALMLRLGSQMLPVEGAIARIEFRHRAHGPLQQYRDHFCAPVHFDCASNAIVFRTEHLDQRHRHGSEQVLEYLRAHLEQVRQRLSQRDGSRELVRIRAAIAANAERGEYGADAVAQQLGTSLRTLQRQLRDEGTTLAALIEEVRQANARQLLSDRRLGVEEIAFLLGYSSARAFRRACIRWTGKTPGQLRPRN